MGNSGAASFVGLVSVMLVFLLVMAVSPVVMRQQYHGGAYGAEQKPHGRSSLSAVRWHGGGYNKKVVISGTLKESSFCRPRLRKTA